jgi:hypothetical protein
LLHRTSKRPKRHLASGHIEVCHVHTCRAATSRIGKILPDTLVSSARWRPVGDRSRGRSPRTIGRRDNRLPRLRAICDYDCRRARATRAGQPKRARSS